MRKVILMMLLVDVCSSAIAETVNQESYIYTLYRTVPSDDAFRVHVATFDSNSFSEMKGDSKLFSVTKESNEFFNKINCERVQDFFQNHPDWSDLRFWCERGRFRK